MYYETFLFTRNQQRDFTAFIRPKELTNKEISTIGAALNFVSDTSRLTPDFPALYCFPLGQYVLLLRHYDSGRQHAGRNIPIIEGIAVKNTLKRRFALALPHFLAHQAELLAIGERAGDIDTLEITQSGEFAWPDVKAADVAGSDDGLMGDFVARLTEDRLFVPFNEDGYAMLLAALSDPRMPSLYFAFGTNSDVLMRLGVADVQVDIVSYFNTTKPSLRNRQTNEITSELSDYVSRTPDRSPTRPSRPKPAPSPDNAPDRPLRPMRQTVTSRAAVERDAADDPLTQYEAGEGMMTMREAARRAREQEAQPDEETSSVFSWLGGILARLLGRK